MVETKMKFPFEATPEEIRENPDIFVNAVFSCLESDFLTMPKGKGFVEYPVFERGYEALKRATFGFEKLHLDKVLTVVFSEPITLVVLRSILGFTPPEWAYIASQKTNIPVTQGYVRSLDRKIRMTPDVCLNDSGVASDRIRALVQTACELLREGAPDADTDTIHRLDKADTQSGISGVRTLADMEKMLFATRGKVFTLKTLDRLVECTRLKEFKIQLR